MLQERKIELSEKRVMVEGIVDGKYGHPNYDKKIFNPKEHFEFKEQLLKSFLHVQHNYYIGISCRCCVGDENFNWQLNILKDTPIENLTYSNLFLNSNYIKFRSFFYTEIRNRKANLICNEHADLKNCEWVLKDFRIKDNGYTDLTQIDIIRNYIKENNINNQTFLFSASSFSNVAQKVLFSEFPNNTYIDIGTTLSKELQIPSDRGYLNEYKNFGIKGNYKTCVW
jgi:predicted nucleic-acid-binding Zn-ribbon protein